MAVPGASAVAHPNIALIKYWGKRDVVENTPAVPSLSITLGGLRTRTTVSLSDDGGDHFRLAGVERPAMFRRVSKCLDSLRKKTGNSEHYLVESENDFPTGAGLASSASGFAALVLAAGALMEPGMSLEELAAIALRASGSAARSLFGGFVEISLGPDEGKPVRTRQLLAPGAWPLEILIAVTSEKEKEISSTQGMEMTRLTSPYYSAWVGSAEKDLDEARQAVERRDFEALADISEYSCLKMHGLMLATRPGLLYFKGATLECIHCVRRMRNRGFPAFFTVDAGPQVKVICLPKARQELRRALEEIPGVERVLHRGLGDGATLVPA